MNLKKRPCEIKPQLSMIGFQIMLINRKYRRINFVIKIQDL